MGWGKGWKVSINKEQWLHRKAIRDAAGILDSEHGTRHEPGERPDLCPQCQAMPSAGRGDSDDTPHGQAS